MRRFFILSRQELNKLAGPSFWAMIGLLLVFTVMDNLLYYGMNTLKPFPFAANFGLSLTFSLYYFVFIASTILSKEFTFGTSTLIFSGPLTRMAVVHAKIAALLFIGLAFALFNVIAGVLITGIFEDSLSYRDILPFALKTTGVYLLFVLCAGCLGILVSALVFNRLTSLIIGYTVFVIFGEYVLQAVIHGNADWLDTAEKMFFYVAVNGFSNLHYSQGETLYLLAVSAIFYTLGRVILSRRDLK